MAPLLEGHTTLRFPCPICGEGLEVRESKKRKPYLVCDRCGVQMFVRSETGIRKFRELVEKAESRNIWERLAELEQRYRVKCPKCRKEFWVAEDLIVTSWFSGEFIGYRCPEEDCDGVAKSEEHQ